ncbi:acyl-CoA reductase [Streptomyces sp. AC555_RSS877]|uniref:acyl-CoA reductase n=1 Tax=Streptomyces sp. AC555_RSS877 TaxID=2823688 RepID=UPI0027E52021|nr:acyl-CoA reductase [Streptomyces sp. AC555_RSS877]
MAQLPAPGLYAQIDHELGGADVLDCWREVRLPDDRLAAIRAFPPRLVHIMAGNAPGVAAMSVVRGALTKGVNLLKLPSNDLFTATAILRTMAAVAPGHPVVRSYSAVYWRGDETVESVLFRPQFFDKLVAWGGEATIRGAPRYVGPGFELVSFDPRTSISLIGREAFESPHALALAADAGAADATFFNQQACVASRFQFVEGSWDDADRYAALLYERLGVARESSSAGGPRVPAELREEIDVLRSMEPEYRAWGGYDGRGLVIRSPEPVGFHSDGKIVDVVPVGALAEAVAHAGVATQTVGVYPDTRKAELRDALACAGVQRVVSLGRAGGMPPGLAHDGFYPAATAHAVGERRVAARAAPNPGREVRAGGDGRRTGRWRAEPRCSGASRPVLSPPRWGGLAASDRCPGLINRSPGQARTVLAPCPSMFCLVPGAWCLAEQTGFLLTRNSRAKHGTSMPSSKRSTAASVPLPGACAAPRSARPVRIPHASGVPAPTDRVTGPDTDPDPNAEVSRRRSGWWARRERSDRARR